MDHDEEIREQTRGNRNGLSEKSRRSDKDRLVKKVYTEEKAKRKTEKEMDRQFLAIVQTQIVVLIIVYI